MPNAGTLHHCTRGTFVKSCAKISKVFAVRMHLHEVDLKIISVLFCRGGGGVGVRKADAVLPQNPNLTTFKAKKSL